MISTGLSTFFLSVIEATTKFHQPSDQLIYLEFKKCIDNGCVISGQESNNLASELDKFFFKVELNRAVLGVIAEDTEYNQIINNQEEEHLEEYHGENDTWAGNLKAEVADKAYYLARVWYFLGKCGFEVDLDTLDTDQDISFSECSQPLRNLLRPKTSDKNFEKIASALPTEIMEFKHQLYTLKLTYDDIIPILVDKLSPRWAK